MFGKYNKEEEQEKEALFLALVSKRCIEFAKWVNLNYRCVDNLYIHKCNSPRHEDNWRTMEWVYKYWTDDVC